MLRMTAASSSSVEASPARRSAKHCASATATSRITLICGESSAPYDRVRLSEILVSGEDPQTLQLRPAEWYADNDVELLVGRIVTWVDAERGVLGLDDVDELAFDRLVLATGSQPLMPPIPGIDLTACIRSAAPRTATRSARRRRRAASRAPR